MLAGIRGILAPPIFEGDADKTRAAWLLNIVLLTLIVRAVIIRMIIGSEGQQASYLLPFVLLLLAVMFVMHRGAVRLASISVAVIFWLSLSEAAMETGGIHSFAFRNYILSVIVSGLLLGRGAAITTVVASTLAGVGMSIGEGWGSIGGPASMEASSIVVTHAISLLFAAVLVTLATRSIGDALERARNEIADRRQAEEAVRESEERLRSTSDQLRALMSRLGSAKEEESIRIAREIHDELGSALTSMRWNLEEMDRALAKAEAEPFQRALRERIGATLGLIDETIDAVRRISSELRPTILDDLGLVAAIEWQAQQFQARTGILCRYDCDVEGLNFEPEQATVVFRIFQEALTNVLRHAQATTVDVSLETEGTEFILKVRDNGRGIREGERTSSRSLGILGMKERAHLIGGEIEITGAVKTGTTVTLRFPHLQGEAHAESAGRGRAL